MPEIDHLGDGQEQQSTKGKQTFDEIHKALLQSKRSSRCSTVIKHLRKLGFEVTDGKSAGHKIFVHDGLSDFYSDSINCGHGKNPEIKPAYINKIIKLIKKYEDGLVTFLNETN